MKADLGDVPRCFKCLRVRLRILLSHHIFLRGNLRHLHHLQHVLSLSVQIRDCQVQVGRPCIEAAAL